MAGLAVLLLLCTATCAAGSGCPSMCSCKWKQGKQTAECKQKGLTTLPAGVDPNTQAIDLSSNNIQRLPNSAFKVEQLTNLQKIYLSSCNIEYIAGEAFAELSNLVELDLGDNRLRHIPAAAFIDTPELRELYLHGNRFTRIEEDDFRHLPSLKSLDLSGCQIASIAVRAFEPLRMLEKLRLHSNRLVMMQPRLVESLANLHLVTVHNNAWSCDCRLRNLREWLVVRRAPHTVPPVCSSPPRVAGRNFEELGEDQFACPPEILPTGRVVEGVVGSNVTVWCPVGGLPTPKVTWYVHDLVVSNATLLGPGVARGYVLDEATEERGSLLVIVEATMDDTELEIRCVATNPAGTTSQSFSLAMRPRPSVLAGFSADKAGYQIAAMASVLVLVLVLLVGTLSVLVRRRRKAHTRVPVKMAANGNDSLPYTPSAFVSGSVVAPSDNPDLLADADSDASTPEATTPRGSRHSLANAPRPRGHARSLDGDGVDPLWVPERVHAMLDSAAPEHVMHRSLHEPHTPGCDALVNKRLLSSSQRHINTHHRLSLLPDFAPDYSGLCSFTSSLAGSLGASLGQTGSFGPTNTSLDPANNLFDPVNRSLGPGGSYAGSLMGTGHTYTSISGVPVPHYGTIPRSMKAVRRGPQDALPGGGTPTLMRHSRGWHYGADAAPGTMDARTGPLETRTTSHVPLEARTGSLDQPGPDPLAALEAIMAEAPIPLEPRNGPMPLYPPPSTAQPLQSHSSKVSRITARDSPDEGYQEGADV